MVVVLFIMVLASSHGNDIGMLWFSLSLFVFHYYHRNNDLTTTVAELHTKLSHAIQLRDEVHINHPSTTTITATTTATTATTTTTTTTTITTTITTTLLSILFLYLLQLISIQQIGT